MSLISLSICSSESLITEVYRSVITMTTVGYGEIFPETNLSRLLTIIIVIIGSISSSILTVSFLDQLKLEKQ